MIEEEQLFSATLNAVLITRQLLQESHKFIPEAYFGIPAKDIPSTTA
ncbi:MAG: hypothetical protein ABW168_23385 [Sedimenticola sp.]